MADAKKPEVPGATPEAPQAPAELPLQFQAQAPEPKPGKSSAKDDDDDEKDEQQQDNPMDLLKPKKDKKDDTQRAAGDQMKLVDALGDTVANINNQVTDVFRGKGSDKADSPAPGPQATMGPADDTAQSPMAGAQAAASNVATPQPPEAPTPSAPTPDMPDVTPKLGQ